ncbi:hypothetical protein [Burkholderia pseudomallei]|uniref:hypothetical protein n=1 Tax=Burkholderia pseudomallei TaxID=28450 RepID=UPI001177EDD9|nr:hypothetical protein [Burkholderia pseudomallei]
MQLSNVRPYLKAQLAPLNRSFFWSAIVPIEGLRVAFWWASPATVAVLFITHFKNRLPASYLEAAISDGIGPHIWNVVGMLGLALFGLAVLFPKIEFIATGAYQVLINTYGMGGLAIGLLIGKIGGSAAVFTVKTRAVEGLARRHGHRSTYARAVHAQFFTLVLGKLDAIDEGG